MSAVPLLTLLLVAACVSPPPDPPASPPASPPATTPTHLRLAIGNGLDGYARVDLAGDTLVVSQPAPPRPDGPPAPVRVVPSAADWAAFRAALDRADAFAWRPRYENPSYADGTLWTVEVAYADLAVRSSGANRYPGPHGVPRDAAAEPGRTYTAAFDAVLAAVRALTGQPFE